MITTVLPYLFCYCIFPPFLLSYTLCNQYTGIKERNVMGAEGKAFLDKVTENIGRVIVGKEKVVKYMLTALLADGHILMEDVPGTGKTKLAKSLARSMDIGFSRIQFTPDLLPSDITGINVFNRKENDLVLR